MVVAVGAVLSANNLLFLILAAMLSILFISGFVSKLVLAGLEVDLLLPRPHLGAAQGARRHPPQESEALDAVVQHSPRRRGRGSGFDGALYFPGDPRRRRPSRSRSTSDFPRRGRHRERSFQFTTRFPFGFAERRELVTMRHDNRGLSVPRSAPGL